MAEKKSKAETVSKAKTQTQRQKQKRAKRKRLTGIEKVAKAESKLKKLKVSVPVPEGLKKAWDRENAAKDRLAKKSAKEKKEWPAKRAKQAKRVAKYEKIYADLQKNNAEAIIKARCEGNFFKPADPKVVIVIRIRGINRMSPKARRVLQLFRLRQIHNAVFLRVNKATVNMLKIVQPYVAYGYLNPRMVRALVYKRGFAKIRHRPGAISRVPIMDNRLVEKHLGKHGIETVEDLVFQIYTCGPHFNACTNFLWPFKLNNPRGGYRGRKRRHYNEGGSYGNWEGHISTFVRNML